MIDPFEYWVNNPLITPVNKALLYDNAIWNAKEDVKERIIKLIEEQTAHYAKTHYEGSNCSTCSLIALIEGEK